MAEKFEYTSTGKPHPYHIVRPSIWPLAASVAAGILAMGAVFFMHGTEWMGFSIGWKGLLAGVIGVLLVMWFWWRDVIYETITENVHNEITEIGMRYGMALFIASEVMFFVAFFWAFFNAALYPTDEIGYVWPPAGIETLPAFDLPFMMTMILLLSGCTVTWAHNAIMDNNIKDMSTALGLSVLLGTVFMGFQIYEYAQVSYGFSDGIYAATFFMATGFHGFHVFIGTVFLGVCWWRSTKGHFTAEKHFGFEAAAWYWHFVDVVWLFLFVAVYWWGGEIGTDLTDQMTELAAGAE